jgi:hypothetical protein
MYLREYLAVAGDHTIGIPDPNEQVSKIASVILHPKYEDEGLGPSDIAIVRLKRNFTYNQFVQPLPIGSPPVEAIPGGHWTKM